MYTPTMHTYLPTNNSNFLAGFDVHGDVFEDQGKTRTITQGDVVDCDLPLLWPFGWWFIFRTLAGSLLFDLIGIMENALCRVHIVFKFYNYQISPLELRK